jgi:hypothetical protein
MPSYKAFFESDKTSCPTPGRGQPRYGSVWQKDLLDSFSQRSRMGREGGPQRKGRLTDPRFGRNKG